MACLFVVGEHANALANATFSTSPSAATQFPASNLADGQPGTIFRFGSLAVNSIIEADLDIGGNDGDFESWTGGTPDGWTEANTGTGTVTQNITEFNSGASSAEFEDGSGTASLYRDYSVRTGATLKLDVAHFATDIPLPVMKVRVQDLRTGKWLKSDSTWDGAQQDAIACAVQLLTWVPETLTFAVESSIWPTTSLRLTLHHESGSAGLFDSVALYPQVDFASWHGHNIDPVVTLQLRSSSDAFASDNDLEATPTVAVGAFYSYLAAPVLKRYWRSYFSGGPNSSVSGPPYLGEWCLAKALALSKGPAYPVTLRHHFPQVRGRIGTWATYAYALSQHPQTDVSLTFRHQDAHSTEFQKEVVQRAGGGGVCVVVPDTDAPDIVFARFPESVTADRVLTDFRTLSTLDLLGEALPLVVG